MLQLLKYLRLLGVLLLGYWLGTIRPQYNYLEVKGNITFTDSIDNFYEVIVDNQVYTVETGLPLPDSGQSIILIMPK
jgi:hypothetical protein